LNIRLSRDICPTHLSKTTTEKTYELSVNINHTLFESIFQYIKSTKRYSR